MSFEHCFECKERFELTESHRQDYLNSGLCPNCYGKAMDYPRDTLVEILEVDKAILENIKLANVSLLKLLKMQKRMTGGAI